MRIVFMGTPDFSVPVLEALVADGHDVVAAYSQPPRPAGRGKKDRPSPVHLRAEALGLPVMTPSSLRNDDALRVFEAHNADVAVVVAYGLILPQAILDAPKRGCLNIHASLLPRWRGAAPIHRAIMAGDAETGVCIMQMDAGLDTGAVLYREVIGIGEAETTGALHDRLSELGAQAIVQALGELGNLVPMEQPQKGVTYAQKIDKSEARVDWSGAALEVDQLIRGLSPFPGAWCEVAGERVKLLASCVVDGKGRAGEVLHGFTIACGTGAVEITRAQRAGKKAMSAEDVLKGIALGERIDCEP